MSDEDLRGQISSVKSNVTKIYLKKRNAAIALCYEYGGLALNAFLQKQTGNAYWKNRTYVALDTVFSGVINESGFVGFFLAHLQKYGIYLELANDRKHEALRPIVMSFYSRFERDLQEIFG